MAIPTATGTTTDLVWLGSDSIDRERRNQDVRETEEHGIEIGSAACAVLGRREELAHRVWRGQSALLLPLLDGLRLHLCSVLSNEYGKAWPTKLGVPLDQSERQALEEDPFTAQWGYLSSLYRNAPALRGRTQLRALTAQAWEIRNELAHYRPVPFAEFRRLSDLLAELRPPGA